MPKVGRNLNIFEIMIFHEDNGLPRILTGSVGSITTVAYYFAEVTFVCR
jgi:hypothetical protein